MTDKSRFQALISSIPKIVEKSFRDNEMSLIEKAMKSKSTQLTSISLNHATDYLDKVTDAFRTIRQLEMLTMKTKEKGHGSPLTKLYEHHVVGEMPHIEGIGIIRVLCDENGPIAAEILEPEGDNG